VIVNDMGVISDDAGNSVSAAQGVVDEIEAMGGEAMAHGADVSSQSDVADMVAQAMARFGRIDILINNAGILRDKTFSKMEMGDFEKVVQVHLLGTANVTHAVWPIMRKQGFGRVVLTASGSGIYGNFGQSNYGAAKAAMIGLMNVLHLEGGRDNIRVNTLAPTAATQMTEKLMPPQVLEILKPETITPGVLFLVSDDAPSKTIMGAGAGSFAVTKIYETQGHTITGDITPESVAENWEKITDPTGQVEISDAFAQTRKYVSAAASALGVSITWD